MVTEIIIQPISILNAIAMEDITLICSASVDDVTYSWHRVEGNIPEKSQGEDDEMFTIPEITPRDAGVYYCTASQNGVIVQSNKAVVTVHREYLYYH